MKSAPKYNYLIMFFVGLLNIPTMLAANTPPPPPTPLPPGLPINENQVVLLLSAIVFAYFIIRKKYQVK